MIFTFMWVGENHALDERIFPTVTARQRAKFGFAGYYLLTLTGLEILNPLSFETFRKTEISFKPSWLGANLYHGITWQDMVSLIALLGMLIWFYSSARYIARSVSALSERKVSSSNFAPDAKRLAEETTDLRFAFNFSAVSFLIALIAPLLGDSWVNNLALDVTLGIFLISGIYCFIEAMKLGAQFASYGRFTLWRWVFANVILKGVALYVGVGVIGFVFYTEVPRLVADDLAELVRAVAKVIVGTFVILAAYLVAWQRAGLGPRLIKFMALVSVAPLMLPTFRIGMKLVGVGGSLSNSASPAAFVYMVVLLLVPLLAYLWSAPEPRTKMVATKRSVAYVRNISWAPFVIADKTGSRYEYESTGYATAEELLEDLIGRTARTGAPTVLQPLRHRIAARLGFHRDFDAIVIDVESAIRLKAAIRRQKRSKRDQYFVIAGVCLSSNSCLVRADGPETLDKVAVLDGPPYLRRNHRQHRRIRQALSLVEGGVKEIVYLPPSCVVDFFPGRAGLVLLPEPFATEVMSRLNRGVQFKNLHEPGGQRMKWLLNRYDVLLVRDLNDTDFGDELLRFLQDGIDRLKSLKGAAMFEDVMAPAIAAELDPNGSGRLDAFSVTRSIRNVEFDTAAVIDPHVVSGQANWEFTKTCLDGLREAGVVENFDEKDLRRMCHCKPTPPKEVGSYPLYLDLVYVKDEPGRLLSVLEEKGTDLLFLAAQRMAAGRGSGFVYLLPKGAAGLPIGKASIGFIPVLIDDMRGSLVSLLAVLRDMHVNIDACFAYPNAQRGAAALIGLGDIEKSVLDGVIRALHERGYDISSSFSSRPNEDHII